MLPSVGHEDKRGTFRLFPFARSGIFLETHLFQFIKTFEQVTRRHFWQRPIGVKLYCVDWDYWAKDEESEAAKANEKLITQPSQVWY